MTNRTNSNLSVFLPPETKKKLKQVADSNIRSMSAQAQFIIALYLKDVDLKEAE